MPLGRRVAAFSVNQLKRLSSHKTLLDAAVLLLPRRIPHLISPRSSSASRRLNTSRNALDLVVYCTDSIKRQFTTSAWSRVGMCVQAT